MEADPIIDWKLKTEINTINIVIVGRTGSGKSATGNSILKREAFLTGGGVVAVTCSSELRGTILNDGRIVNVIDTPGLFDSSTSAEVISEEIVKCINLAKDGIHVVLMVFSLQSRFITEEKVSIEIMKSIFGDKIVDYIIIVLTHGDFLESQKKSLKDYITHFPESMRNIIQSFKNRVIVLDNTTKDMIKREKQVKELLSLVEYVIVDNGGQSYSNKFFAELKEAKEGCSKEKLSDDVKKHLTERVDETGKSYMERFLKEQVEQLEAKLRDERLGRESQGEEIRKLKEDLNVTRRQYEEIKKRKAKGHRCSIL
ncbi:immune-associated nucleotide-binding protein 9 [Dendrobium catenatum]|uniref:AIG1-type G domain-containing protein n=2 Tax=Dendrobium TaxID=37818 RepID=A0A8T3AEV6_DENNO|nr:immune-associated nucleotide-binding protein 9 [Dendrobium catenatum]KAI0494322.1 hypothetical protein KFK09_024456 [Dendrobium nobile]PKU83687.1 Protein AIG1 [Dendrobium catenatum]